MFFLVLEEGPQFASRAAIGSLLGILGWATFNLVYAYACLKLPWWSSTLIGWIAYVVVAVMLLRLNLSVLPAFVLVASVLILVIRAFPKVAPPRSPRGYGPFDLWLRMASASFMIVTLTAFARLLGPIASGILSAFPAYTTILAVFSHRHQAEAAVHVLKGVVVGLYTAATFFLVLSPSLLRFGATAAFSLAIAGCLLVQTASLMYVRRNVSAS